MSQLWKYLRMVHVHVVLKNNIQRIMIKCTKFNRQREKNMCINPGYVTKIICPRNYSVTVYHGRARYRDPRYNHGQAIA